MEKKKRKYSRTDKVFLGIGFTILGLFVLSIAIPIIYVVLASFMDPTVLNNQGLSFNTKDWTLDAYRRVLENEMIWRGFLNSFLYSLAFAVISVFVTLLAAYPLSKKEFVGRDFFNVFFEITLKHPFLLKKKDGIVLMPSLHVFKRLFNTGKFLPFCATGEPACNQIYNLRSEENKD